MAASSGILPFFLKGTQNSSSTASVDLFLYAVAAGASGDGGASLSMFGTPASGSIPLFLKTALTGYSNNNVPLFIEGTTHRVNASLNLFLPNSGTVASIYLYIKGSGTTEGSLPFSSSIPLFLKMGEAEALPMFLACSIPGSGGVDLYIRGANLGSGNIPLYVYGQGSFSGSLPLFTAGY